MDAGPVERFRGVDVANADDHRGVHQKVLDGRRSSAGEIGKSGAVEPGRQGLDAEMPEVPVAHQTLCRRDEGDAETTRIPEAKPAARSEFEAKVLMVHERRGPIDESQAAAHSEVQYQRLATGSVDPQVLRAPAQADDLAAFQAAQPPLAQRLAQGREVDANGLEAVADEGPFQAPPENLDFG